MTLTNSNRWAAAGAIGGAALIIYNPLVYRFMDMVALNRNYVAKEKGTTPTMLGYILHTIVLFFVVYGILCVNWACA